MATLTVRNLDEDLVKRLHIRAAEHGRSAEAEHREILKATLAGSEQRAAREQANSRLAEFRRRTAGRGSPSSADLLEKSRRSRAEDLAGKSGRRWRLSSMRRLASSGSCRSRTAILPICWLAAEPICSSLTSG